MEKKYNTTLIIGNGFDLDLGMETSYKTFYKSLADKDFFASYADNPLLSFIRKEGGRDGLWYDFESIIKEFAEIGTQAQYLRMTDTFLSLLNKAQRQDETAYRELVKFHCLADLCCLYNYLIGYITSHDCFEFSLNEEMKRVCNKIIQRLQKYSAEERKHVEEALKLLREELVKFLKSKESERENAPAIDVLTAVFGVYTQPNEDKATRLTHYSNEARQRTIQSVKVVSFNYTDTREQVINLFKPLFSYIWDEQTQSVKESIFQIHGSLEDNKHIVFGIDDKAGVPKKFNFLRKSKMTNGDTKAQFYDILKSSQRILIFGHSITGIDYEYYEKFFNEEDDGTEICIINKTLSDLETKKRELENLGVVRHLTYLATESRILYKQKCSEIAEDQRKWLGIDFNK